MIKSDRKIISAVLKLTDNYHDEMTIDRNPSSLLLIKNVGEVIKGVPLSISEEDAHESVKRLIDADKYEEALNLYLGEDKDYIKKNSIPCPTCGKHNFTDIRQFNLMFKTFQGVTEDAKNTAKDVVDKVFSVFRRNFCKNV